MESVAGMSGVKMNDIFYAYSKQPWYCLNCREQHTAVLTYSLDQYVKLHSTSIACEKCKQAFLPVSSHAVAYAFGLVELEAGGWVFKKDLEAARTANDVLKRILNNAYNQSAKGKGIERHGATGATFAEQQIVSFGLETKSINYNIGQANKKIREALNLPAVKAIHELLGAINYIAGAIAILEKLNPEALKDDSDLMKGGLYDKCVKLL
mgnify:FL=1